jgi:putative ATP-binding cassette transporter
MNSPERGSFKVRSPHVLSTLCRHWRRVSSAVQPYWQRFVSVTAPYWKDPCIKWQSRGLLASVLILLAMVTAINLEMSYINKNFMDALQDIFATNIKLEQSGADTALLLGDRARQVAQAYSSIKLFLELFAIGAIVVGFYKWVRERFILHWRAWLTSDLCKKYFAGAYYRLNSEESSTDNPDDRIQEVRQFVHLLVTLLADFLSSLVTICVFLVVLYHIYPTLLPLAVIYPLGGTLVIMYMARQLIKFKLAQLIKEADFRFAMGHVRRFAEQIAFYQGEQQEAEEVRLRFAEVVSNYKRVLAKFRTVTMASKFYEYMIIVIPSLIMLPALIDGRLKLGDLTQADMAFAMIMQSLSIVVTSFDNITEFLAQTTRLGTFEESLVTPVVVADETIAMEIGSDISVHDVTLLSPDRKLTLFRHLSLSVAPGQDLLIKGPSGSGKSSLFRMIRGLWFQGDGNVIRPDISKLMFIPQAPYMMMRASLRKQLFYPFAPNDAVSDQELYEKLALVNLSELPKRLGAEGLDEVRNWANVLSLGEQQRFACARMLLAKPEYVFFDEGTNSLDPENEETIYRLLQQCGTTFISIAHRDSLAKYHKQVLELEGNGKWRLYPVS